MRFNLRTMLYAVAVLAAGMGAFGLVGFPIAAMVLWFWAIREEARNFVIRFVLVLFMVILVPCLLIPAIKSGPPLAVNSCRNNLRQIALALQNYADIHGTLPPPYIADKNGKPVHSWRMLIQPYLEGSRIYDAYDFNEPWNGPSNCSLSGIDLNYFRCPSAALPSGETTVFAVVGPNAAWVAGRGRELDEFADGAEQTLLLIEVVGRGVNWMEPKDVSYEEALALLTADNVKQAAVVHAREEVLHYTEYSRNVAFADGSVDRLPIGCPKELAEGLVTINGGELLADWRDEVSSSQSRLHWPRIWGVAVFLVLAILPWVISSWRRAKVETDLLPNACRVASTLLLAISLAGCSKTADPAAIADAQKSLDAAQAALAEKKLDEAIPLLTAAIESGVLSPDDTAGALVDRAVCLARVDMFDLANADLDAAANAAPLDRVRAARSFVFAEQGKESEAETEFQKARQINPSVERIAP